MKLRAKHSPLLLLLLPSLATALATPIGADSNDESGSLAKVDKALDSPAAAGLGNRHNFPTKDAPVDGKDGKPHTGPFIGSEPVVDSGHEQLPPLKGRPVDPTMVDGKKIPETNDGVMFDKNRERPQEGTTGTQGGVSEKDKARKDHETKTGEKYLAQPASPKEQPPLPHSEQERIDKAGKSPDQAKQLSVEKPANADKGDKNDQNDDSGFTGLDKPDDLPDRTYDSKSGEKSQPLPGSLNKDHLEIEKTGANAAGIKTKTPSEDAEGFIQPFHSFVLSCAMILVSEVGDKTFLIAALMAMKHDRLVVFSAAFGALLVMTVLSAVLGHALPALIPKKVTSFLAAGLFFIFGAKLLREGLQMDSNTGISAEMYEVEQELAEKEKELDHGRRGSISQHTLEMGLDGRRSKSRFPAQARSPSQSPSRSPRGGSGGMQTVINGMSNLCSLLLSPAWVQTFIMTFLGEWGDRSQFATIAMAAGQDYWWVTMGATFGHSICTGVAVIGGRAIAGRVSLKVVTVGGAVAFLVFGLIYLIEALYA